MSQSEGKAAKFRKRALEEKWGTPEPAQLADLPDDVLFLVHKELPLGLVGCGDFRALSPRTRRLANSTVTKARVATWKEAALMGTTFPQLEELKVEWCSLNQAEGTRAFMVHSAPHLTGLVSLDLHGDEGHVSQELMEQLRASMPQLQQLRLSMLQRADNPWAIITCITQLHQLKELGLQAQGATREALALLQRLPNLLYLDLTWSDLGDEQLAGLEGLTGLGALNLNGSFEITLAGLQALLPRLQLLTSLQLLGVDLGEEGFALLAQQAGLQQLEVQPRNDDYSAVGKLTRLQHLTMLGARCWEVKCDQEAHWSLLCSSSLRALDVCSISEEAAGPPPCLVTHLKVVHLSRSMPLLPGLSKLEVTGSQGLKETSALMQHTTLTELVLSGGCDVVAAELGCLALLPRLRALQLSLSSGSTPLSDNVLQSALGRCTGLERLTLAGLAQLTDQGLERIARRLPALRSLEVQRCDLITAEGRERALRVVTRGAAARGE